MSKKLDCPIDKICTDCKEIFSTKWLQNKCNPCKRLAANSAWSLCKSCGNTCSKGRKVCWDCHTLSQPSELTLEEASWLAGYLDAEGCFSASTDNKRIRIKVEATDKDIISRCKELTSVGTIREVPPRIEGRKTSYVWSVGAKSDVQHVVKYVIALLSTRKSKKIRSILNIEPLEGFNVSNNIAWLAGYLEGDGCFGSSGRAYLAVESIDLDSVEKIDSIVSANRYTRVSKNDNHNDLFCWRLTKADELKSILLKVEPLMGSRRSEQINKMLTSLSG